MLHAHKRSVEGELRQSQTHLRSSLGADAACSSYIDHKWCNMYGGSVITHTSLGEYKSNKSLKDKHTRAHTHTQMGQHFHTRTFSNFRVKNREHTACRNLSEEYFFGPAMQGKRLLALLASPESFSYLRSCVTEIVTLSLCDIPPRH